MESIEKHIEQDKQILQDPTTNPQMRRHVEGELKELEEYVQHHKKEVQEMIDDAIRQHNRNASIISFCVGWVVLALFAEGLLRLIGVIEPLFPWLKITLN